GSSPITADARRAVAQRRLVRRRKRCQSASLPRQLRYLGRSFFVPFFSARFCKSMTTAACSRRRFGGIKKQMSGERVQRKSAFVWQVVLILLPVVILAVIGWTSLRQDKILAEHDARQRAQAIADQLAPSLWTQLTSPVIENLFFERGDFSARRLGRVGFSAALPARAGPCAAAARRTFIGAIETVGHRANRRHD